MPGIVRAAVAVGTLPFSLSIKFQESHAVQINSNEYHDGSCQRISLVIGGRRTWKLSKRLDAFNLGLLRDFYEAAHGGAFYFYNPFETVPPFSRNPSGTSGRYLVRFNSDWSQTNGMARSDASIELIELAGTDDITGASTTTNSAVPTSATLFLTSAHAASPDFTPVFGAGASLQGVGFIFPVPSWFNQTSGWSTRTNSLGIDPTTVGGLSLLLMLEHEGIGSSPLGTPDVFQIYDAYALLTYGDGSVVTYRPTTTAVDATSTGATGSVTAPENAIDGNGGTFATITVTQYGSFFSGVFLNLSGFQPSV